MNTLDKISNQLSKYMAILVLLVAGIALIYPPAFVWIPTTSVNWLLGIVMLGMGMTLKTSDFKIVFTHPREVILGCLAQICIMPYFAWLLARLFRLPAEVAIGVGMQNAGLATSLAAAHFAMYPLATLPGAVFTICHNITGAVAANIMANWKPSRINQIGTFKM